MVTLRDLKTSEQIRINLVPWRWFGGVWLRSDDFQAHKTIQPSDPLDVDVVALVPLQPLPTCDTRRSKVFSGTDDRLTP